MNKEKFCDAVASSISIAQVLSKIGLAQKGGNYNTIHRYIKLYKLDTSHFIGQRWSKGKKLGPKKDINDYLSNKYPIGSHKLKLRLIAAGILEPKCSNCGIEQWLGLPAPLELDHINGNHDDNSLSNIRIVCPNCHAIKPKLCR
jgi:hypothetical protein